MKYYCKYCDEKVEINVGPGKGPHYKKASCVECGKFLRWLPKPCTDMPEKLTESTQEAI
jgi:hypothetical protein